MQHLKQLFTHFFYFWHNIFLLMYCTFNAFNIYFTARNRILAQFIAKLILKLHFLFFLIKITIKIDIIVNLLYSTLIAIQHGSKRLLHDHLSKFEQIWFILSKRTSRYQLFLKNANRFNVLSLFYEFRVPLLVSIVHY